MKTAAHFCRAPRLPDREVAFQLYIHTRRNCVSWMCPIPSIQWADLRFWKRRFSDLVHVVMFVKYTAGKNVGFLGLCSVGRRRKQAGILALPKPQNIECTCPESSPWMPQRKHISFWQIHIYRKIVGYIYVDSGFHSLICCLISCLGLHTAQANIWYLQSTFATAGTIHSLVKLSHTQKTKVPKSWGFVLKFSSPKERIVTI